MTRTLVITGGHGVLGRAVLEAAVAEGLNVAVIDHARGEAVPDGVLEFGGVDLTDGAAAEQAMKAVIERFGRIDALLNIAGGLVGPTVADADPAWDRLDGLSGGGAGKEIPRPSVAVVWRG